MCGFFENPRMVRPLAFFSPASSFSAWAMNSAATAAVRSLGGVGGDGRQRRDARFLRVGVGHVAAEALGAEHDHEAVFLDRLDEDLDAGDAHLAKLAWPAGRFPRWGSGPRGGR